MVNYKAIADEAEPHGDYQTAFDIMSIETTESFGLLSSNNLREWSVENPVDYGIIKANGDVLTEIALKQIEIDTSSLNLSKASAQNMVNLLPISAGGKTNLFDKAKVITKKWQGLKPGHVQNALQKRAEGKV